MSRKLRDFLRQATANAVGSIAALLIAGVASGLIRPHWAEVVLVLSALPMVILAFKGACLLWHRLTAHLYPIERADGLNALFLLALFSSFPCQFL